VSSSRFSFWGGAGYSPEFEPESEPLMLLMSWSIVCISPVTGSLATDGGEYVAPGAAESEAEGEPGVSDASAVDAVL
jgi:hypothetical protein